ncbi:MAG: hypothetical protein DRP23_03965 [Thermotogae bacterium]|nr:MAG: hypothetical protein DRP23_03965 [Thermotogota bacterium]
MVVNMGEIEKKIWEEIQQNEDFRKALNENMKKTAERLARISFFSETFRKYNEKIARGEIEIY